MLQAGKAPIHPEKGIATANDEVSAEIKHARNTNGRIRAEFAPFAPDQGAAGAT
jgi:hypothetical protein